MSNDLKANMESGTLSLTIQGCSVDLPYLRRAGVKAPLVCLHGFGSTKEDYADLTMRADFADRDLIFWDAPGCGASRLSDPDAPTIPFLVATAKAVCDALGLERFHLLGHSMGGLTALFLAQGNPDRVLSFIDIEGNLAPEDCFLSRQIVEHPADTPDAFMAGFQDRVRQRAEYGSALYAIALPQKVRPTTFKPVFTSMVELSDTADLLDIMAGLPCPRIFIYGAQNDHLSYLPRLPDMGVKVIEIPDAGHFPFYSNPPALWSAIAAILDEVER